MTTAAQRGISAVLKKLRGKIKREAFTKHWSGTMGWPCSEVDDKPLDAELDSIEAEIHELLKRRKKVVPGAT